MENLRPSYIRGLRCASRTSPRLPWAKMQLWGLNTDDMGYDPWDYVQASRPWNFLPFLLRRVGAVPRCGGEYGVCYVDQAIGRARRGVMATRIRLW